MMIYQRLRARGTTPPFFFDVFPDTSLHAGRLCSGVRNSSLCFFFAIRRRSVWREIVLGRSFQRLHPMVLGSQNLGELRIMQSEERWLMKGSLRFEGTGSSACNNSLFYLESFTMSNVMYSVHLGSHTLAGVCVSLCQSSN